MMKVETVGRKKWENPNETKQPCPSCGASLYRRTIHVVSGDCWKCHRTMPIAFGSDGITMMGPAEFVPPEIEAARQAGALLREQFSKTTQSAYLANTCESCGAFCGDHYLHDFWENEPSAPLMEVTLGCVECFTAVAVVPDADGKIWTGNIPHEEDEDEAEAPAATPVPLGPPSKSKTQRPPAPPPVPAKVVPVWGRCGECSAAACPTTLNDGKFFCSQCRGIRKFVPDLL